MSNETNGATTINVTFKKTGCETYLKDVSNLIIGNMVEPGGSTFWLSIDQAAWTWNNNGENVKAFGLMGNYDYQNEETTAYSMIVIDPTKLEAGTYDVVVTLSTAEIGPGNNILKFESATVNGSSNIEAAYPSTYPNEAPAKFYTC
jgi:hypothetical protein